MIVIDHIKNTIIRYAKKRWIQIILIPVLFFVLLPLPSPLFDQPLATTIETEQGELLGAMIAEDGQWRFPFQDSVAQTFKESLLYFEDEYFYAHLGINPISMFKALLINFKSGHIRRGGSTISMQVIRMSRGNQSRTIFQKIIETLLAIKLEILYSKQEILQLYMANAPFGGNVVGLHAASWRYYGRPPQELSWGESAALAVLPNSPSLVFPGKNEMRFKKKRDFLLHKLYQKEVIDSMTYILSVAEDLPGLPVDLPRLAPRLLTRAVNEGRTGKRNTTTIDYQLQKRVQRLTTRHVNTLKANYIHNGAVLVIDLMTGETKAYVGNVDTESIHGDDVDIITSQRSTGSLLKPFLYAAAIDEGLILPKQLIGDYPIFYEGFAPKNFDLKHRGAVHADDALTRSLNLPFVILLRDYGYEKFHQKLKRIGMNSLDPSVDRYGLSLILGGAESSLWEMSSMYTNLFRVYRKSFDQNITNLYNTDSYHPINVWSEDKYSPKDETPSNEYSISSIWTMLEAMKGLNRPKEMTGWQRFGSSTDIAWKTGTSFGFRDAWSIGMNGRYLVGVWTGNADGEGRPGLVGGVASAPLMFSIFQILESESFGRVPTHETVLLPICKKSGMKANPYCTDIDSLSLPVSSTRGSVCKYHQFIHLDKDEKYQVNSSCYPVREMKHKSWFVLPPVQSWYYRKYHQEYKSLPVFSTDCNTRDEKHSIDLIYPKQRAKVYIPKELDGSLGRTIFEAAHTRPDAVIHWHLDEQYLGSTQHTHHIAISTSQGKHHMMLMDQTGTQKDLDFEVISDHVN